MAPDRPDLYSRWLLLQPRVARCRDAAEALLAAGPPPAQLMVFDGERLSPFEDSGSEDVSYDPVALCPVQFSEMPVGRLVVGLAMVGLGLGSIVFMSTMMSSVADLIPVGGGFTLLLMGLWAAGLLPQVGPIAVAGPGRIEHGGVVFKSGLDVVAVYYGGWKAGPELMLINRSGCVRSMGSTDARVGELAQLWRATHSLSTPPPPP